MSNEENDSQHPPETPAGSPGGEESVSRYPDLDILQQDISRRLRDNQRFLDHFLDDDFMDELDDEDEDEAIDPDDFEEL